MEPFVPTGPITLRLGDAHFDVTRRALVMGILNRTRDSFFAPAATFEMDDFLSRAEALVADGADVLDVGGVKAGPGDEVTEGEELERVIPAIEALHERFDVPLSVDTWRATVARDAFAAGAVLGNDISGFADPDYLSVAVSAGASVVATHIRLRPRVADPDPRYDDVIESVRQFLVERRTRAIAAGLDDNQVLVDAGLDLGKTPDQSLQLLRATSLYAGLGSPVLLSASNKGFLGALFDLEVTERREATLGACALGIGAGARVLRVHDVGGTVRVRDAIESVLEARV